MEYNPTNLVFAEWLASKFYNHLDMDWYTKNALGVYWMRGDYEVVLSNKEVSDLKDENNDEREIAKVFRIETNLLDYETPLCIKFNEFNYLLKDGKAKWPTCNSNEDGFCNGGELPGMVRVGYMTYFQDYEWYDELADDNLKEEALKQKGIYEKSWGDGHMQTSLSGRNSKASNNNDVEDKQDQQNERRCDTAHNASVCKIIRFKMIKYSFGQDEEYVAIRECEYDNLTRTNEDACRTYQEIFHSMDEGWVVTRAE
ncbi:hypothetical protein Tco_0906275 [Tanacetum coccineum]